MEQINLESNTNLMIEELNNKLKQGLISNWKVNSFENKKYNVYVESDYRIESILNSSRKEHIFTIYANFKNDLMGTNSFTLGESESVEKFKKELNDAIFICSQSKNKKYELPKKEDLNVDDSNINYSNFYSKKFEDDFNSNSLALFYENKLNIFKKLIDEKNDDNFRIKLNTIEFLNSFSNSSLKTSNQINKNTKKGSVYLEFVLTVVNTKNNENSEYIVYENINDLYSFNFKEFFEESINAAIIATKKSTVDNFTGKVILSNTACVDFFTPDLTMNSLIGHCSSRLKFLGISKFEKNKQIINSKKDKITIYSNSLLSENAASSAYDSDGISAKKTLLIENSIFKNYFASKQYADYLGIQATGPMGVIEIESGSKSYDKLFEDNDEIIEILSFSSFVPDLVSGDFSAEIRLGNKIINGKKTPFKGGLFSGNIFDLFEEVELSSEKIEKVGYLGPKTIKFHKGNIVGL